MNSARRISARGTDASRCSGRIGSSQSTSGNDVCGVRNFSTTSPQNIFGTGSAELDAALEKGRSGATMAERQAAYDEVNTYLAEQAYPLVYAAAEQMREVKID